MQTETCLKRLGCTSQYNSGVRHRKLPYVIIIIIIIIRPLAQSRRLKIELRKV